MVNGLKDLHLPSPVFYADRWWLTLKSVLFALFPHQSSFLLITLCQRLNDFVVSDLPAYGCVQTPLCVSYLVRNRTLQVQEVEVTVEPSDAFMYSGHKQVSSGLFLSGLSYKQARAVSCFYAGRKYVHMLHQVIVASKCSVGLFLRAKSD